MRTPPRTLDFPQSSRIAALALSVLVSVAAPSASVAQDSAITHGWVSFDGMTPLPVSPTIEILSSTSGELVLAVTTPGAVSVAEHRLNPDTVFRFAVPEACRVRVVVYDLAGRRVRTLVDGPVPAGWQTATWDGRTDRGERAASGVYFCRLETGAGELSRKVVLLK